MLSLYDLCLQQVLSIREPAELFAMLAQLQIKRDPLENPRYARTWITAAGKNPAVLDWLVLNTEKTITQLIVSLFTEALTACCIEVLHWFSANIRLELKNTAPIGDIVTEIMLGATCESDDGEGDSVVYTITPLCADFLNARTMCLKKDDEVVAHWIVANRFHRSTELWMVITHSIVAPKVAMYLANEPGHKYRKNDPKYSFYLKMLAKRKRPED